MLGYVHWGCVTSQYISKVALTKRHNIFFFVTIIRLWVYAQLQKQKFVQRARGPSYKRCQNHCAESSWHTTLFADQDMVVLHLAPAILDR